LSGRPPDHLIDLGRVAMSTDAVGRKALIAFGKMRGQLGRASSAAHPAFAIHDDVVAGDQPRFEQRGDVG
jgi:hypothetical protein